PNTCGTCAPPMSIAAEYAHGPHSAEHRAPAPSNPTARSVLSTNHAVRMSPPQQARNVVPTPLRLSRRLPVVRQIQSVSNPPHRLPTSVPLKTSACRYPESLTDTPRVSCRNVGNQLAKNMYPPARAICWAHRNHTALLRTIVPQGVARGFPSGVEVRTDS